MKVNDVLNNIWDSQIMTVDIETSSKGGGGSLNRHRGELSGLALGWANSDEDIHGTYVDFIHPENDNLIQADFEEFKPKFNRLLDKWENPVNCHNAGFDVTWLWENGINIPHRQVVDSMLASHLIDSNNSHSLDDCVKREFDYEMSEISEASFDLFPELFSEYSWEDSYYQTKLWLRYVKKMDENDLLDYYGEIIQPLIPAWIEMEYHGFKLNRDGLKEMSSKIKNYQHELEKKKYEFSDIPNNFNFDSPKQISELFFGARSPEDEENTERGLFDEDNVERGLGFPKDQLRLTDTGNYPTDKKTLRHLEGHHPIVSIILEYKNVGKLDNTFIENLLESSKDDGRAYTNLHPHGTHSGRFSSSGPNLQNIPSSPSVDKNINDVPRLRNEDLKIRKNFVAPGGKKLIVADYSQAELRWLAHYSEEPSLVNSYKAGIDAHKQTASDMFDLPVDEVPNSGGIRKEAKVSNYGLTYLMKIYRFSQQADFEWEKAKNLYELWWSTKGKVVEFYEKMLHMLKKRNPTYVTTYKGRPRYFEKEIKQKELGKAQHYLDGLALRAYKLAHYNILGEAGSHCIQGSSADMLNLALGDLSKAIEGSSAKMLLQVHDEVVLEANNDEADDIAKETKDVMENCIDIKVPIRTEPTVCDVWSSAK